MAQQQLIGESKQFNEKIITIKSQFLSALDDFKKYYIFFNRNPEVNEFQNYYANSKGQLQTMNRNMFLVTNNIEKNIQTLNKFVLLSSIKLNNEKALNKQMTDLINNLENTQNGSEILVDDSKTKYNIQYYKNVEMFIGILIVCGLMSKLFKNKD